MAARSARWYSEAAETTPVLKKLTVERFKSIRHAEVGLGRINLFIGGNGAGKSNVLEAIGVLSASADRGVGDTDLSRKGVRITPPELMKSAFKNHPLPRTLQLTAELEGDVTYGIELTGKEDAPLLAFFSESCTQGAEKIFGRGPNGVQVRGTSVRRNLDRHRSLWDQVRAAFDFPVAVDTALRGLAQYAIYAPQTDFLRGMAAGKLDTPPIGLHGEGLPHAVRGLLEQWEEAKRQELPAFQLKDRATDLPFLPGWARVVRVGRIDSALTSRALLDQGDDMVYFLDQYMHHSRSKLSVYDSSEGTLFLLFVAILLAHDDSSKIFALDNVDNALNPRMTRVLLETIIEIAKESSEKGLICGPRQVFLTSHNPTSLDAFDLFDEDQRVFVVERNEDGHTTVTRLKPCQGMTREEWQQAKNGRNLSQFWLDGEIRGALGQDL